MSFNIIIQPTPRNYLVSLGSIDSGRIQKQINRLAIAPKQIGYRLKHDLNQFWSHSVGDYRICYQIDDENEIVDIILIYRRKQGDRDDVYNVLRGMAEDSG